MNQNKHDLNTILQASRMVIFHNEVEGFDYTLGGSSFLVKIKNILFAVTAKHVLENNQYSPNDVLIRYNEDSREFLPFDDIFFVKTKDCSCNISIANVFTPNGDGINETFSPIYECEFKQYQFNIFNRWGKLIFSSNNPTKAWDGKYLGVKVPDGVYFYIFTYENMFENEQKTLKGSVTIFR